jgi:hypothetical protein
LDLGLQAHKGKGNIHMIGKVKILSLFLASVLICGVGVDDVKAQSVTITDPTNDPTLQSGNGSSVTYTWSGVSSYFRRTSADPFSRPYLPSRLSVRDLFLAFLLFLKLVMPVE